MEDYIWSILGLCVISAVIVIFAVFFLPAIFEAIINGGILYFIFLKTFADLKKRKRYKMYFFAGITAGIFLAITRNIFPLWFFTTWAMLYMFIVVLILIILNAKDKSVV